MSLWRCCSGFGSFELPQTLGKLASDVTGTPMTFLLVHRLVFRQRADSGRSP